MCINIILSTHLQRDDIHLFSRSSRLHFILNSEKKNRRRSGGVHECAKKKAVYFSWVAKDKNIHNYTPKYFASSYSADSPRSKFKHFHFAVFRRKRWKKNIAQYVGGKHSYVIFFFSLLQELNSSVERVNAIFEQCFCALIRNFEIRLDYCLYFIFITTNDKCFHLFFSPSGVQLWGHIKYRA